MKREIKQRKISGLWRSLIRAGVLVIVAMGLVPGIPSLALAEQIHGRGATFAAGFSHSCVLLVDGMVQCWGGNQNGQLGNGSKTDFSWVPVTVSGITNAVAVVGGGDHTCALLANGTVQCWGENRFGQLGNGTLTKSAVPVTVIGLTNATAVAAGWEHSCAILADGRVTCWGLREFGEDTATVDMVVTVSGITNAVALAGGIGHTCAVLADGRVQCWGRNGDALGKGTTTKSFVPVSVSGITNAVGVTSGYGHSCALLVDGAVQCWGDNTGGQLGNGTTTASLVPVSVSGITNAVVVASGYRHSCALLADGRVQCWGDNSGGQLGNGTTTASLSPVPVGGLASANAVAAGGCNYSCVVLADGVVQCWGHVHFETLGNRTMSESSVPVIVSGLATTVAVAGGAARRGD